MVANKLKSGVQVEAETFNSVTLLMMKVANFGEICAKVRPTAIVAIVNEMHMVQDRIMSKYDVYKVGWTNEIEKSKTFSRQSW